MEANQSELCSLEHEAVDEGTKGDRLRELAKISIELARIVASNSSAPPELLQELADSSDTYICKCVAANPNTPVKALLKLGRQFPKQVIDNPCFPLMILENPNFVTDMPLAMLRFLWNV